jgi:hypothetical protein
MYLKAGLFVSAGSLSAALLVAAHPTLLTITLVAVMIWSFSRAYYFCFYVLERYIDPSLRFSGLASLLLHIFRKKREVSPDPFP